MTLLQDLIENNKFKEAIELLRKEKENEEKELLKAEIEKKNDRGETILNNLIKMYGLVVFEETERQDILELIKELAKYSSIINEKNINGNTPLHLAIGNNYSDIVKILLTNGADVNITNKEGEVPLHIAVNNGDKKIIELLQDKKVDNNAQDSDSSTLLHLTTKDDEISNDNLLLDKEADVNVTNDCNTNEILPPECSLLGLNLKENSCEDIDR